MEDQFIKDIEKFDNQLIKYHINKIRNEIFNVLEDLRKKNDKNYEIIVLEENRLFHNVKNNFNYRDVDNSEEVNKLTKLNNIYSYLSDIFNINRCRNESINNLKSLIKD